MDIKDIKTYLKKHHITYDQLSEISGVPLNTLKNIFSGRTPTPRIDTMQAILTALGLDEDKRSIFDIPGIEPLISDIEKLSPEQIRQVSDFVSYLLSKNS